MVTLSSKKNCSKRVPSARCHSVSGDKLGTTWRLDQQQKERGRIE